MRRCYRGAALALGGILMTGLTSHDSCSFGALTVYAAADTLTEELETAFQEEVQTGEENVETDIPAEENTENPEASAEMPKETQEEPAAEDAESESAEEKPVMEEILEEPAAEAVPEEAMEEPAAEEAPEETAEDPAQEAEAANEPVQPAGNSYGLEEQEYQVLLKIVEAEAGGEDTVGRMLVANVIMNRVRSGRFPNTVTEVVYQRCSGRAQFSPVSDGRIDQVSVSPETVEAVSRAINGEDASAGALYFRSVYSSSSWFDRALHRVIEHGNHIFYTM